MHQELWVAYDPAEPVPSIPPLQLIQFQTAHDTRISAQRRAPIYAKDVKWNTVIAYRLFNGPQQFWLGFHGGNHYKVLATELDKDNFRRTFPDAEMFLVSRCVR